MASLMKDALIAIGLTATAFVASGALGWYGETEYLRGVAAGRRQAQPAPTNCVAWWFGGDPTRADRNLKAACAARTPR